ncbi:uncharacterized protein [Littorina saxatilis]|uniref:uncharacterized protein isoform X2 n=1 Tax=Littorina saxatilis TaxID=31220 RepID=UPI0038B5F0C7
MTSRQDPSQPTSDGEEERGRGTPQGRRKDRVRSDTNMDSATNGSRAMSRQTSDRALTSRSLSLQSEAVSMTAVASRENDPGKTEDPMQPSTSVQSAHARLGEHPHVVNSSSKSSQAASLASRKLSHIGSGIIQKIRDRDLKCVAVKTDSNAAEVKGLTCAVCLEVYNNPKFLPCHHTYCAACIEDLSRRRPGKPMKCPTCRKEVVLPSGGVSALQNNFYIRPEDLEKAQRGIVDSSKCLSHPKQELDLYCTDCEQVVCFKCVMTKHKDHSMQDLVDAAAEASDVIPAHSKVLDAVIAEVSDHAEKQKKEQKYLEMKMDKIRKNLQNRHDTIVAAAQKFLQESLEAVDKVMEDVTEAVVKDAKFAQSYMASLNRLQKNIEIAIKTKAKVEIVEADRDMRVGYGCRAAVDELLTQRRDSVCRPVVRFGIYTDQLLQAVRQFLGPIDRVEVTLNMPEMNVAEKFRCGDEYDTEVFSLCPKDNGTMSVSYERRGLKDDAPSEGLDEKGRHHYTRKEATGKSTWKSRGKGKGVFVGQLPGQFRTYAKGQTADSYLRLDNYLAGRADVKRETIVCESPYKSRLTRECTLKCRPHRAFDASSCQTIFVVLEEAEAPQTSRRVVLFHRGKEDSVATYTPRTPVFQPTDVCFHTLKDSDTLLVSDELNDAIHVLDFKDETLTFTRFLVPGCPVLVQPTALNVDAEKRLWVACRGGSILVLDKLNPQTANEDPAGKESGV